MHAVELASTRRVRRRARALSAGRRRRLAASRRRRGERRSRSSTSDRGASSGSSGLLPQRSRPLIALSSSIAPSSASARWSGRWRPRRGVSATRRARSPRLRRHTRVPPATCLPSRTPVRRRPPRAQGPGAGRTRGRRQQRSWSASWSGRSSGWTRWSRRSSRRSWTLSSTSVRPARNHTEQADPDGT